ncbi:MAG: choice-of-anchor L domain-containing protein, partial [Phycisphaerales bacterium]
MAWSIDPTLPAATIEERLIAGAAPLPPSLLDPAIGRLDVFESTFDGSFELPGLGTWVTEGTVSVLESLGRLVPTDRMRMAYVSTGPAGAGVAASLRKEFTVQPGVSMFAITFDYDFVTEEWPEYVGTQYNDSLRIVLVEPDGVEVLLAVETINDSIFYPIEGIDFPGGDDTVGHTGWKTVTAVVPITKGPGSYTVRIEDAGDDVYDSVALVDRIRLIGDPQALYCGAPQAGDCCEEHPTPFCADGACCNTVCLVDPTCCQTAWDAGCATLASELCDSCTPVQEICDNGIDDDGDGLIDCDDPDCAAFPGCTKSGFCGDPQSGDCCEANGTPFCSDAVCCEAVCAADAFCCATEWDQICAERAATICDACAPPAELCDNGIDDDGDDLVDCDDPDCAADPNCPAWGGCGDPNSGDCCEGNGTPFCSNASCCETVCAADAFCCATEWDQICAQAATTLCGGLCGGGAQEVCDNGIDDDGDGLVDCDDPECAADPNCPACPDGLSDCQGQCVDLATDLSNCGACGVVCDDGDPCTVDACVDGVC